MLSPREIAAGSQRSFKEKWRVHSTKSDSTDSEDPLVEIAKTIGLKRWIAVNRVALSAHFVGREAALSVAVEGFVSSDSVAPILGKINFDSKL